MTIMTAPFAEKCHLTRLLDERFKGMAVGVGSSKILGKIHQVGGWIRGKGGSLDGLDWRSGCANVLRDRRVK